MALVTSAKASPKEAVHPTCGESWHAESWTPKIQVSKKVDGHRILAPSVGSTAGGTCAYDRDLFGVPVVATVNFCTKKLQYLEQHDWLVNPGNRVLVQLPSEIGVSVGMAPSRDVMHSTQIFE